MFIFILHWKVVKYCRLNLCYLGTLEFEINVFVKICLKLGHIATLLKNTEQAVNFYKEGLQTSPNNIQILVALANLYMQMSYLELCQQTCSTVLRIDPENETASVLMADIAFRKVRYFLWWEIGKHIFEQWKHFDEHSIWEYLT